MICHLEVDSFVKTIETQTTTIDFVKILLHKVIETAAINLIEILFDKVVESPTVNLVKILLDKIVESTTVNFIEVLLFHTENHAPKKTEKKIILQLLDTLRKLFLNLTKSRKIFRHRNIQLFRHATFASLHH